MARPRASVLVLGILSCASVSGAPPWGDQWRAVAERLIRTAPESYPFNWGEGVQAIGLMKVYDRSREQRYADYVDKWAALYTPKTLGELLDIGPISIEPKIGPGRPGYCGRWAPATAILYLYQVYLRSAHLRLAEQVGEFISNDAERGPEGGLGHWQGSHQLWVDTLYMACPLLAGLGKLQSKQEYVDDAANQIVVYARHLQDPQTGLFYHMWDWQTQTHSPDFWGRGNGWVLMSLADTLEVLDRKHPSFAPLKTVAEKLARGLRATEDKDGLWHTVLNDHASYAESSATSMVCYGLLKLVRLKVLPASYRGLAQRAWSAVSKLYVRDGVVIGVSGGTGPFGADHYRTRPQGSYPWGTGAYLMAGSEIDRLR